MWLHVDATETMMLMIVCVVGARIVFVRQLVRRWYSICLLRLFPDEWYNLLKNVRLRMFPYGVSARAPNVRHS